MENKILFVLPHYDFDDDEYFKIRDFFDSKGILTEVASTHMSEAEGRFRKLVNPDFLVEDVEARDYDAFVFISGVGASELYHNSDIQRLVNSILVHHKVIALIGEAVPILYYANVLKGRQVTTLESLKEEVENGGAYYSGIDLEQDGDIITGFDARSSKEVARAVVRSLDWEKNREEAREGLRRES